MSNIIVFSRQYKNEEGHFLFQLHHCIKTKQSTPIWKINICLVSLYYSKTIFSRKVEFNKLCPFSPTKFKTLIWPRPPRGRWWKFKVPRDPMKLSPTFLVGGFHALFSRDSRVFETNNHWLNLNERNSQILTIRITWLLQHKDMLHLGWTEEKWLLSRVFIWYYSELNWNSTCTNAKLQSEMVWSKYKNVNKPDKQLYTSYIKSCLKWLPAS